MKKFAVTDENMFRVYEAFDRKKQQSCGYEDFPRTALEKGFRMERKTPKIKFCHIKTTSPVESQDN